MCVLDPASAMIHSKKRAPVRKTRSHRVIHSRAKRTWPKAVGPGYGTVCTLAQRDHDRRRDQLDLGAKETLPAVSEPLRLYGPLEATALEAQDRIGEEHASRPEALPKRTGKPNALQERIKHLIRGVPWIVHTRVPRVIADVAPVLTDDHQAGVQVPVKTAPRTYLVGIVLTKGRVGWIAEPRTRAASLPISDERDVAITLQRLIPQGRSPRLS